MHRSDAVAQSLHCAGQSSYAHFFDAAPDPNLHYIRDPFYFQWLQKANIPAPRAAAYLAGFNLEGRRGGAVLLEAIEPSVTLDEFLNDRELRAEAVAEHRKLANQVIEMKTL